MLHLIFNLTASKLTRFCVSLCSFKTGSFSNHFDPVIAHRKKASRDLSPWCLFCCLLGLYSILTYYLTLYLTPCIEVHSFLRVALLLQKGFTFEPFRSCYRPPNRKTPCDGNSMVPFSCSNWWVKCILTDCFSQVLNFCSESCFNASILYSGYLIQ